MFAIIPVYNSSLESEDRYIQPAHIEEVKPNANVPVDPGEVDTPCCMVRLKSGQERIVLLDMDTMKTRLIALTGVFDDYGTLT